MTIPCSWLLRRPCITPFVSEGKTWDEPSGKTGVGKKFFHNIIDGSKAPGASHHERPKTSDHRPPLWRSFTMFHRG